MNADAKLTGYVLRNKAGKLLTRQKWWMNEDVTGGWIWSEKEVEDILVQSKTWDHKPAAKQAAYLNRHNGSTVIFGAPEALS